MGGGTTASAVANQTALQNMGLENEIYGIGKQSLQAGTNYLTDTYKGGGIDQSAKYAAMQSGVIGSPLGGSILQGNLGQAMGNKATAISGIGGQKLAAGVDEMNKIRSMLAQKGLRTTNLAQESGAQAVNAIPQMQQGNQTLSTIMGIGAVGAGVYGGYKNDQVAQQMKAQQFFGNPWQGSNAQYLQFPSGGNVTMPGTSTPKPGGW